MAWMVLFLVFAWATLEVTRVLLNLVDEAVLAGNVLASALLLLMTLGSWLLIWMGFAVVTS